MIDVLAPSARSAALAAAALAAGQLVILPTDTVYGVAADVRRDDAVRALYALKGKGEAAPLQLLFGRDARLVEQYATLTPLAARFIADVGPGPWTVIVPAADGCQSLALAGGRTVGIRIPDSAPVLDVVDALGAPVAASSANRHGSPSPVDCATAIAGIGDGCALAIDAGPTPRGLDSTVIDLASGSPRLLREGAFDRATVARILGFEDIPVIRSVRS